MYNLENLEIIANNLDSFQKFCAITVALKIADDSCKMDAYEKSIFMALYDAILDKKTDFFDDSVFELISTALTTPSAKVYGEIKKLRESAMDMISRPKMKSFKAEFRIQLSQ
ncbi:MAG: hypothetical protein ACI9TV_001805 [Sulfurimonas sp.]|jgi:hypothetical protein|uniref:hypothetical protein n=1 Tax=Sulfurimonas sp. TaxID=2022749 RepID=UPI0039E27DDE